MKVALLLPGYLDSPDYLHMKIFERRLKQLGYVVERIDPCNLWSSGDVSNYSVTNYIKNIKNRIDFYKDQEPEEILLIGHSLGGFTSILAGNKFPEVSKIVALCPPSSIEGLAKKWQGKSSRVSKRDLPDDKTNFREFDIPQTFVEDALKFSAIEAVRNIKKPLMIFIGMEDTSVPPEETEILVSNAINPYVIRMQKIGHDFRHSENESDLVMTEIQKFLAK